jgi:hypothetical protein
MWRQRGCPGFLFDAHRLWVVSLGSLWILIGA